MTYIITHRTNNSILMASDTRLNYHNDKVVSGEKCQEIVAIADCIKKTFYIDKAKIGIQFLGIGYFSDGDDKYPLSHFIDKINSLSFGNNFTSNCKIIFDFLKKISIEKDTGAYVKGVMAGFKKKNKSAVCLFNTFNSDFRICVIEPGQFVDSENSKESLSKEEEKSINQIIERIRSKSKTNWWNIGEEVELISITKSGATDIYSGEAIFAGSQKELLDCFKNNISKINGRIIHPPYYEKYNL